MQTTPRYKILYLQLPIYGFPNDFHNLQEERKVVIVIICIFKVCYPGRFSVLSSYIRMIETVSQHSLTESLPCTNNQLQISSKIYLISVDYFALFNPKKKKLEFELAQERPSLAIEKIADLPMPKSFSTKKRKIKLRLQSSRLNSL